MLVLLFVINLFALVLGACPNGTIQGPSPSDCYQLIAAPAPWATAETNCKNIGGHLTSIHDAFHNTFVDQQIQKTFQSAQEAWLGGNNINGAWAWSDGTAFDYKNWANGQPINTTNFCSTMNSASGSWNSKDCTTQLPYVCKVGQPGTCSYQFQNFDIPGWDLGRVNGNDFSDCCTQCINFTGCVAWTFLPGSCYLKSSAGPMVAKTGTTGGIYKNVTTLGPVGPPQTDNSSCPVKYPGMDLSWGFDYFSEGAKNASACCDLCGGQAFCIAYAWSDDFGGTCWFKSGISKLVNSTKPGSVVGFLSGPNPNTPCPAQYSNGNISGGDIGQAQADSGYCCGLCIKFPGCVAYTWSQGTCYFKSIVGPIIDNVNGFEVGIVGAASTYNPNAPYQLKRTYAGTTFFDAFKFNTFGDPTDGTVDYVNETVALSLGLITFPNGQVRIAADSKNVYGNGTRGRPSVRVESIDKYNEGLFILDLPHIPTGPGTWPAYWLVGGDWPANGEVDILEGVDDGTTFNHITLHTRDGCDQSNGTGVFTGNWTKGGDPNGLDTNCYIDASANVGCGILALNRTFGRTWNEDGGGVYATEWVRDQYIKVWIFKNGSVPADITNNGIPNPATWGTPMAWFTLGEICDPNHFNWMSIIINLTFCGAWAGNVYPGGEDACVQVVRYQPQNYTDAYWIINSLKVFGH